MTEVNLKLPLPLSSHRIYIKGNKSLVLSDTQSRPKAGQ